MEIIKITDSESRLSNIVYMYGSLSEVLSGASKRFSAYNDGSRSVMEIELTGDNGRYVKKEIEDKIADVIAVGYKHAVFSEGVHPYGLTEEEREILLSSLIAADIDDDREYIKRKIVCEREYSVDGLFNFRLTALKKKWQDVVSYVPKTFDGEKLKDFLAFILEEKRGNRVFVDNQKVYDKCFRRVNRTSLTGVQYGAERLVNEIILSGAGEAELLSGVSENAEEYLRDFLGNKIIFGKTYFCN